VLVSNSAPDGKLTLEMVKNSMLNEEARKKEKGDASSSDAYVAESHGKKDVRGRGQARFQQSKDQKSRGDQSQERDKKSLAFIVASQITRRSIAGYTREILQRVELLTRMSKKVRMVLP
jgi:hypothetical protein